MGNKSNGVFFWNWKSGKQETFQIDLLLISTPQQLHSTVTMTRKRYYNEKFKQV